MQFNNDIARQLDIRHKLGDTFKPTLTFKDSTGAPIDLTAYDWTLNLADDTGAEVCVFDNIVQGGTTNSIVLNAPATLNQLPATAYRYELRYTNTANSEVRTILYGKFTIIQSFQ